MWILPRYSHKSDQSTMVRWLSLYHRSLFSVKIIIIFHLYSILLKRWKYERRRYWVSEILIKVKYNIYKLPSNLSKISCLKKQIKSDQKETLAQPNKQAVVDHSKSISVYFWLDYLFCILANIFQKQSFVYQSATQNWWTKTENLTLLI